MPASMLQTTDSADALFVEYSKRESKELSPASNNVAIINEVQQIMK